MKFKLRGDNIKTGLTSLLLGIIFNTFILTASTSSEVQIIPLKHGTQVSPNSITSTSELDSFKNEIFSKQQEIQSVKEDILVLGDLIRDLESKMRRHREAEQIKQRILLLKKK
jgi:hypothetical protein